MSRKTQNSCELWGGRAWVFIISVVCFLYGLGLTMQQLAAALRQSSNDLSVGSRFSCKAYIADMDLRPQYVCSLESTKKPRGDSFGSCEALTWNVPSNQTEPQPESNGQKPKMSKLWKCGLVNNLKRKQHVLGHFLESRWCHGIWDSMS